jgi:hypothetical protein
MNPLRFRAITTIRSTLAGDAREWNVLICTTIRVAQPSTEVRSHIEKESTLEFPAIKGAPARVTLIAE